MGFVDVPGDRLDIGQFILEEMWNGGHTIAEDVHTEMQCDLRCNCSNGQFYPDSSDSA